MRILHIISSLDISQGGPSMSVSEFGLHLAQKDIEICLLSVKSKNPYIKDSPLKNLVVTLVDKGMLEKTMNEICRVPGADLLHGHGLWQMPVHKMSGSARKMKIPYIISPHGMLEPWSLKTKKIKKGLALWGYQRRDLVNASCIHATSLSEAENIRKLGFTNPIAVIPNGIDLSQFNLPVNKQPGDKKTILFLSRIHPKKGCELLIEAWHQIDKDTRKGWQVEIAGAGEESYIRSLKELITKKGLSAEIKLTGPRYNEERLSAYHNADLFVLPTYSENFGLVIAEAMACGLPVITTRGTPWEELNSLNAGWWTDIGVDPLVNSMKAALQLQDDDLKKMGINGRKLVEENYSILSLTIKMKQLYNWILGNCEKPEFIL
jgi:glycosyltransferase involved in cell wall biosynthesis